jgi:hypothetical protein
METFISLAVLLLLVLTQHMLIIKRGSTSRRLTKKLLRSETESREVGAYAVYLERQYLTEDQFRMVRKSVLGRDTLYTVNY